MSPRHSPAPEPVFSFTEPALTAVPVRAFDIGYERAGRQILGGVSLRAEPGQVLGLVGPSGSGKSSLLAVLAGLEPPDAGRVELDPRDQRLGLILQGYGLAGVLTAAENVEIPLQAAVARGRLDLDRYDVRIRAAEALEQVGLSAVADHRTDELSGGQQQRTAVARALAYDPTILFADELTAELDHEWRDRVVELVFDIARRGGVVVVATHDPDIAAGCDVVVRLVDGRVAS